MKLLRRCVTILVVAAVIAMLAPAPALAFDARSGTSVSVASGEVVEGDLYLFGNDIAVNGVVTGDVFAFGQSISINGEIKGGLTAAGNVINLMGKVGRGARLAGQAITVKGAVAGDLVIAGQQVEVLSDATVAADLVLAAATARVFGSVGGNVRGAGSEITLGDGVGKNVDLKVEKLTVASNANIQGDLNYTSPNKAEVHPASRIRGSVNYKLPPDRGWDWAGTFAFRFVEFLMALTAGAVVILVARRRLVKMSDALRSNPWRSLGYGALILIAVPFAAILMVFTIIGLPLGVMTIAAYFAAMYLGQLPVSLLVGRLILKRPIKPDDAWPTLGQLALGLAVLGLVRSLPVVGFASALITLTLGLGLFVTSTVRIKVEKGPPPGV